MEMTARRPRARYATKVCPRCGARLYEDMNVCYDCLYDFTREGSAGAPVAIGAVGAAADTSPFSGVARAAGDARGGSDVPVIPYASAADSRPVCTAPSADAGFGRAPSRPTRDGASDPGATQSLALPVEALLRVEEVGMLIRTPVVDAWVPVSPGEGCSLGRDPANDIVLHAPTVSRRHLRLAPTPDGMQVIDLGSTNPATYRGEEVHESVIVPYGDSVELCGCVLTMTGPEPTLR